MFKAFFSGVGLFGLFLSSLAATAQSNPKPVPIPNAVTANQMNQHKIDGCTPYRYVEKMPVYLDGGKEGLQTFISSHVRGSASGSGAYISFIIDQNGKARNLALGPYPTESEAAADPVFATAFRSIGNFKPGYQNGKAGDVELTMPISKPIHK